ncbi:uncharacterized protein LOC118188745 isoform X2 [Stegodyphus dumicola]|uniref:uncharacterized protein LOC118188745 isoform X2 n=1 Tax=Stegodyphus dumicola TaxID=202533 RepID=UPI0015ADA189|nr:uncharacterized protein LOC118188745 isoform X2 [Stegodyphus dumicola]
MPGTTRYSATFDRPYEEEEPPLMPTAASSRRSRSQSWQANSGLDRAYTPLGGTRPVQHRSSSTDSGSTQGVEHIPTRTVVKTPLKAHNNPFQFVKVGTCPLYKKAEEQIKKVKEIKKPDVLKEEEEEWQSNLDSWKSRRRKMSEDVFRRQEELRQMELEEQISQAAQKKTKTFSEMVESRAHRGRTLSLCLISSPLELQNWEMENNNNKNSSNSNFSAGSEESSNVNSEDESVGLKRTAQNDDQNDTQNLSSKTNGHCHNSSVKDSCNNEYNTLSDLKTSRFSASQKEGTFIDSGLESISSSHKAGDTPDSGSDFSQDSASSMDCESPRISGLTLDDVNLLDEYNSKSLQMSTSSSLPNMKSSGIEVAVKIHLNDRNEDLGFAFLCKEDDGQIIVDALSEESIAYNAGVHLEDQILAINGESIASKQPLEIASILERAKKNGSVDLLLWRHHKAAGSSDYSQSHTSVFPVVNGSAYNNNSVRKSTFIQDVDKKTSQSISSANQNELKNSETCKKSGQCSLYHTERSIESENEMYVDDFEELNRNSKLIEKNLQKLPVNDEIKENGNQSTVSPPNSVSSVLSTVSNTSVIANGSVTKDSCSVTLKNVPAINDSNATSATSVSKTSMIKNRLLAKDMPSVEKKERTVSETFMTAVSLSKDEPKIQRKKAHSKNDLGVTPCRTTFNTSVTADCSMVKDSPSIEQKKVPYKNDSAETLVTVVSDISLPANGCLGKDSTSMEQRDSVGTSITAVSNTSVTANGSLTNDSPSVERKKVSSENESVVSSGTSISKTSVTVNGSLTKDLPNVKQKKIRLKSNSLITPIIDVSSMAVTSDGSLTNTSANMEQKKASPKNGSVGTPITAVSNTSMTANGSLTNTSPSVEQKKVSPENDSVVSPVTTILKTSVTVNGSLTKNLPIVRKKKIRLKSSSLVTSIIDVSSMAGTSDGYLTNNSANMEQKKASPKNDYVRNSVTAASSTSVTTNCPLMTEDSPNVGQKTILCKSDSDVTPVANVSKIFVTTDDCQTKNSSSVEQKKAFSENDPVVICVNKPALEQKSDFKDEKQNLNSDQKKSKIKIIRKKSMKNDTSTKNVNTDVNTFANQKESSINQVKEDSLSIIYQSQPVKENKKDLAHDQKSHEKGACVFLKDDVPPVEKVAEEMEKLILEQLEEEERAKEMAAEIQLKNSVNSPENILMAPLRLAEPPKEKPPPPPSGSNEPQKPTSLKRVNSTKRIKKEIHKRRSNFLGIENADENISCEETSVPPPPALEDILKAEMELDRESMRKLESAAAERLTLEENEIIQKEQEIIQTLEKEERQQHIANENTDFWHDSQEKDRIQSLKEERKRIEEERMINEEQHLRLLEEAQLREREEYIRKQEGDNSSRDQLSASEPVAESLSNTTNSLVVSSVSPDTSLSGINGEGKISLSNSVPQLSDQKAVKIGEKTSNATAKPAVPPKPLKKKEAIRKERERLRQEQEALQREREEHRQKLIKEQEELAKNHPKSHAPDVPYSRLGPLPPLVKPAYPPQLTPSLSALPGNRENITVASRSIHGSQNGSLGSDPFSQLMNKQNRPVIPSQTKVPLNEIWGQQKMPSVRKQNHEPLSESRYNQNHWLIQEAEMRRITELKERQRATHHSQTHLAEDNVCSITPKVPVLPPTQNQHQNYATPEILWTYGNVGSTIKKYPSINPNKPFPVYAREPTAQAPVKPSRTGPLERQEQMLSVSGRKRCSHCNEELGRGAAMIIESLQLYYHIHCFQCCVCQAQLGNGSCGTDVRVRNNKLHCHNCYSNDEAGVKCSQV